MAALPSVAVPHTAPLNQAYAAGHSWMAPEAATSDLLYVAAGTSSGSVVYVLTYPHGKLVGTLTGFYGEPLYLCADSGGNVFITAQGGGSERSMVYEFRHGHTKPIAALRDPGDSQGCSVNPQTGDLAVANLHSHAFRHNAGNIAIYRKARGSPKIHWSAHFLQFKFCGYDGQGNLLAVGGDHGNHYAFAVLPHDGHKFKSITLDKPITTWGPIQWDGTDFAIGYAGYHSLYRVTISGSHANVVKTIHLGYREKYQLYEQFWVQTNTIVAMLAAQGSYYGSLGFWTYPHGGRATKFIKQVGQATFLTGAAVSVAPK